MNKQEKEILLNNYKENYNLHHILNYDKTDILINLKYLLDNLDLKKDRYIIENEIISEKEKYNFLQRESFKMIFEMYLKYNVYVNYDLKEIAGYFEDLQFIITDEEIRCHQARIRNIENH